MGEIGSLSVLNGTDSRRLVDAPLVPGPTEQEIAAAPPLPTTVVYSPTTGREIARVTVVRRASDGPVNVAILGQCYVNDADVRGAALRLSRIQFPGSVVMVHWTTTCPVPPAERELYRGLLRFWRYDRLSDDVAGAGVAEVNAAHAEARELGANFASVLASIPIPLHDRPVHLYAHSMGAAVLREALERGELGRYQVGRAVFMGGTAAATLSPRAMGQVRGPVVNFYRPDDWILGAVARVSGESQIGMNPIPAPSELQGRRIFNVAVEDIGHRHYWANGNRVLRSIDALVPPETSGVRWRPASPPLGRDAEGAVRPRR